ncbi:hypothetical protein [Klebsiella pneumoniae]|uniref:hypothetical protein n=1 Tax=Klebsiella pneumoniae TaxID=573 RepID=UPI00396983AE
MLRTPAINVLSDGFSHCWATASSAFSSGIPAATRVASWRVSRAKSPALVRRVRDPPAHSRRAGSAVVTSSASQPLSRSSWRAWRAESAC